MSHTGRMRGYAMAVLVVVLLASSLALAPGHQRRAHAYTRQPSGEVVISAPGTEGSGISAQQESNSRQDVLEKALLTVGIAAAAGVVGLIGYAIRKRTGFWLHRPQTEDDAASEEHH